MSMLTASYPDGHAAAGIRHQAATNPGPHSLNNRPDSSSKVWGDPMLGEILRACISSRQPMYLPPVWDNHLVKKAIPGDPTIFLPIHQPVLPALLRALCDGVAVFDRHVSLTSLLNVSFGWCYRNSR